MPKPPMDAGVSQLLSPRKKLGVTKTNGKQEADPAWEEEKDNLIKENAFLYELLKKAKAERASMIQKIEELTEICEEKESKYIAATNIKVLEEKSFQKVLTKERMKFDEKFAKQQQAVNVRNGLLAKWASLGARLIFEHPDIEVKDLLETTCGSVPAAKQATLEIYRYYANAPPKSEETLFSDVPQSARSDYSVSNALLRSITSAPEGESKGSSKPSSRKKKGNTPNDGNQNQQQNQYQSNSETMESPRVRSISSGNAATVNAANTSQKAPSSPNKNNSDSTQPKVVVKKKQTKTMSAATPVNDTASALGLSNDQLKKLNISDNSVLKRFKNAPEVSRRLMRMKDGYNGKYAGDFNSVINDIDSEMKSVRFSEEYNGHYGDVDNSMQGGGSMVHGSLESSENINLDEAHSSITFNPSQVSENIAVDGLVDYLLQVTEGSQTHEGSLNSDHHNNSADKEDERRAAENKSDNSKERDRDDNSSVGSKSLFSGLKMPKMHW